MRQNKIIRFLGLPIMWVVVLGLVGLACGFFGSIFLNPNANLVPFWILVIGPFVLGAFVLGGAVGLVGAIVGLRLRTHFYAIGGASIIVGIVALYMSTPEDRYRGFVVDGEVRGCKDPKYFVAERVKWWQQSIDKNKRFEPRTGWREDLDRMLDEDRGVVLEVFVHREIEFYETRKPWNDGVKRASSWEEPQKIKNFYARFNGSSCANYSIGERSLHFPEWEVSRVSPPDILPTFLGLSVLTDVPIEFEQFVRN